MSSFQRNFEVPGGSGRTVVSTMSCDNAGSMLVPVWDEAVDVLEVVVAESDGSVSPIN